MASKPKLKPCPFCGGEAQLLRISKSPNGVEEWFVSCGSDSCSLYPHSTIPYASAEIAAAAWNRRAVGTPSNAAAMREALEFADSHLRAATEDDRYGDDLVYLVGCMLVVAGVCRDALAAPPRNCDVPHKDGHELWVRWQNYGTEIFPSRVSFSRWLLAPAKKGGAK